MLRQQNYVIPGYVRDGYLAPWSPLYIRSGYVRAGYLRSTPRHVNHAALSFDLRRLPGYPEYEIVFDQWQEESGGGVLFTGNPYSVRLYHKLSWSSICKADRDNWEALFFATRGSSEPFVWFNPVNGNSLRVRFADADFPETPEIGFEQYRLDGLRLLLDLNLSGQIPTGVPNYSPSMGTALSIGWVVMQFPAPVRPNTGYGIETRRALEITSSGQPAVWRTGKVQRRHWTLSWTNLRYIHWIRLRAFFCSFVRGMRTPFIWYDTDGTARTMRLAEPSIVVRQTGFDRFTCELPLLEDF